MTDDTMKMNTATADVMITPGLIKVANIDHFRPKVQVVYGQALLMVTSTQVFCSLGEKIDPKGRSKDLAIVFETPSTSSVNEPLMVHKFRLFKYATS